MPSVPLTNNIGLLISEFDTYFKKEDNTMRNPPPPTLYDNSQSKLSLGEKDQSQIKMIVDNVIKALEERPETFCIPDSKCTLIDNKGKKVEYWIANSTKYGGVHRPFEIEFGQTEGERFYNAVLKWETLYIITGGSFKKPKEEKEDVKARNLVRIIIWIPTHLFWFLKYKIIPYLMRTKR